MLANGVTSFYSVKEGATLYYDIPAKSTLKNRDKIPLLF